MEKTVREVIDTMTEEQQTAMYMMLDAALSENSVEHSAMGEDELRHAEVTLIEAGTKIGSLKEAILAHADYGIENIETLFPDAQELNKEPKFLNHNVEWVAHVLGNVSRQPFSRLKTTFSDITTEKVRAKGYAKKANRKTEEVLTVMKRTTTPTTLYKKQRIDRDDMIDITDFNVIEWIRKGMRLKLEEEIARCILVGDGRDASSDDYVDRECIRPIHTDDDLYSVKVLVADRAARYSDFIDTVVRNRKLYKGSGNPSLYTTEDVLAELLLLKDADGRPLYRSVAELATTLRVKDIITVNHMEDVVRVVSDTESYELMGIIANLADYSIGADKGGQVAMFDDFDIDYNQQKYLIETRCSGALTEVGAALVIECPTQATVLKGISVTGGSDDTMTVITANE